MLLVRSIMFCPLMEEIWFFSRTVKDLKLQAFFFFWRACFGLVLWFFHVYLCSRFLPVSPSQTLSPVLPLVFGSCRLRWTLERVQQRPEKGPLLARMQKERLRSGLFRLEKEKWNHLASTASYWDHVQIKRQTLLRGEQGENWGEPAYVAVIGNIFSYREKRKVTISGKPKLMV